MGSMSLLVRHFTKQKVFSQFGFEDWAKKIGGPFSTPLTNDQKDDIRSSANLQNEEVEGLELQENSYHQFSDHQNNRQNFLTNFDEPNILFPSNPSQETGGNFDKENVFVPLTHFPTTDDRDLGDQYSEGDKAIHLMHADAILDRSDLDFPLDSDPQIEKLFFGDHEDLHEYPDDGDSPTHPLHFNDYNNHKPFPSRCKFEVSRNVYFIIP